MERNVVFTRKAELELYVDDLTKEMVYESIWNAPGIYKTIRSTRVKGDKLYVITGLTLEGILIYTKKIQKHHGKEVFYVFISTKRSTDFR